MALKATICKAELGIADMDRHYYADHALTIAQHPSENNERLMLRLLAFALFANERLEFTRGISTDDEPDLWQKNYHDEIELWIDLGQPSEKRLRKACGKAQRVVVISYGGGSAEHWWQQHQAYCERFTNLTVLYITPEQSATLLPLQQKSMRLQFNIQEDDVSISGDSEQANCTPIVLYPRPA